MPGEATVRRKVLAYLKTVPGAFYPIHGNQFTRRGAPDIAGCYKFRFVGIETKSKGGKQTRIQKYEQSRIEKAGGFYAVCRSVADVKKLLTRIERHDFVE